MKVTMIGLLLVLFGCTSGAPEKVTALAAFRAIAVNDWQKFQPMTITSADLLMKAEKISRSEAKSSFVGGVLKPEQLEKHRQDFERAVATGLPARVKLSEVRFIEQATLDLLNGNQVTAFVFAIEAEVAQPTYPRVVIVAWGSFYKVIALQFPQLNP